MSLESALDFLQANGLVRPAAAAPFIAADSEYLFKHVLVQETAYGSLLRHDRKALHSLVANVLEQHAAAALDQFAPILAQHWDNADEPARAFPYYLRAGELAARVYAHAEARMAYDRAAELARDLDLGSAQAQQMYSGRGRVLELQGDFDAALACYQEQEAWGMAHGDSQVELDALIRRTTLYTTPNKLLDLAQGVALSQHALQRARAAGNRAAEAKIQWNILLAHFFAGKNLEAVQAGEQSLALARELDLREQMAYTLNDLARPYILVGGVPQAEAMAEEAQQLWRELNNLPMLADNLVGMGMLSLFSGKYYSAIDQVEEGLRLSHETGNAWGESYAHETLGILYAQIGELALALEHLFTAARVGKQVNYLDAQYDGLMTAAYIYLQLGAWDRAQALVDSLLGEGDLQPAYSVMPLAILAVLKVNAGDVKGAEQALERAHREVDNSQYGFGLTFYRISRATVLLKTEQWSDALQEAQTAVAESEAAGTHVLRAQLMCYQAQAVAALGNLDAAVQSAQAALDEAATTQSHPAWLEALALLSQIYASRREPEAAERARRQALEQLEFLTDHMPSDLRPIFLRQPEIIRLHVPLTTD